MEPNARKALELLKKHWGYDSFRSLQLPIIESVTAGHDTLGLLPTGGGKSLTFQIPALMLPGLTLVVTPLISLMKDQVDNLREHNVRACLLHSGLSRGEHNLAMDRCRLGKAKLLYLSPEKLQSKTFIDTLSLLDVSMIVVDEAHCISQWGYDFRPSYLQIARLRRVFPGAVMLALTASATPEVSRDIMDRLEFRTRMVFAKSFSRPNISYVVRHTDHKPLMLLRVLRATSGSAIVYVRSRKRTLEIARMLQAEGITAENYHAGLAPEEKNERQNRWKQGATRVMVATNAFGMGIDKPDVRTVIHIDPPSSLEEYYQEAGRAGRDGLPSFAVLITSKADKATLTRRLNEAFPDKEKIRRVYELAGNFLSVAVGSGYNAMFEFDFALFCERFHLNPRETRSALALLTSAGYIDYIDEISTRSRVMVILDKRELYELRLDTNADRVLQLLLRTYTGLFADYVNISEELIASRLNISFQQVYEALLALSRQHAIAYVPRKTSPYLIFTTSRELPKHVQLPRSVYEDMRSRMHARIESMKSFIYDSSRCRVQTMLRYFGETDALPCGTCDVCRRNRKKSAATTDADEANLRNQVLRLATQGQPVTIDYVAGQLNKRPADIISIVRRLADEHLIAVSANRLSSPEQC
ncbi:MAG: RecQ family ATP-dependent DNA helicase [Firmicutes bacterium]|nr:RecQ family ATP-dependent DNA helicase [Bacillota bacterium]MCM1401471.1 RecQ family ATP-dependent DNA helicase [Bacteroides sp.]MCM1477406.1 RecQ family ATP-dependent DNA helicase [Bacteroides sp.]